MAFENTPVDPKGYKAIDSETKRNEIAQELASRFFAWEDVLMKYDGRWQMNERLVRNDPERPLDVFWNGFQYRHIPVTSSKAKAWQAYVCSSPTAANPYIVGTLFGKDATRASEIEDDFYLFMRKANFDRTFRMATWNTGLHGKSLWRVRGEEKYGKPCFAFDVISMRRSFLYPDDDGPIDTKLNVGHSFDVRVGEIWDDQDAGRYYLDSRPDPDSDRKSEKEASGIIQSGESISIEERNKFKRVVECFDKRDYGTGEKWYRVRFVPDGQPILLAVYEYPYTCPWYFDQFVHEEQGRFIPETSRFNDIQDLQLATNEQWNLMNAGQQMAALGVTFAAGWAADRKMARAKPGSIFPILQGGTVSTIQSKYDAGVAPLLLEDLDRRTDHMMRLGQQAQGGETSGDKTATAANIRKLAVDVAINDDLANIDICMGQIGRFLQELYRVHYPLFQAAYGESLSVQDPSILEQEVLWELNGKSPANTPQAQGEQAIALAQMLIMFTPETIQIMTYAGIDWRELLQGMVRNSTLDNKQKILLSDEQVQQAILQQQLLQSAQSALPGPMDANGGMGVVPGSDAPQSPPMAPGYAGG